MITALLTAAALAAPTLYAPDAAPGDGWTLAAGPGALSVQDNLVPGAQLDLGWAGDRWGARAVTTGYLSAAPELFVAAGLRYRVWSGERLHVAPYLSAVEHLGASPLDHRLALRAGVAAEARGERLSAYASLPLIGASVFPAVDGAGGMMGAFETLMAMEAGAGLHLGGHSVRAGLTGFLPTLGYRYDREVWYADAAAGTLGLAHMATARVGIRR